jgi:uncharacterized membrane protein
MRVDAAALESTLEANIDDMERMISLLAGAGLLLGALSRGRGRALRVAAGAGLVARGVVGYCPLRASLGLGRRRDDTRRALGGSRGIVVEERASIASTPEKLYAFWRRLENLPQIFQHLESVTTTSDRLSHWVMRGPAGTLFEWDAEIINDVRPDLIAWRSLPGADIATAGSVHFRERARSRGQVTDVTVRLQYDAPGGRAASALAWITGESPDVMLRNELRRLKRIAEEDALLAPQE